MKGRSRGPSTADGAGRRGLVRNDCKKRDCQPAVHKMKIKLKKQKNQMLKKGSKSSLCGSQAQDLKREDSEGLR